MNWKTPLLMIVACTAFCLLAMGAVVAAHSETVCGSAANLMSALSQKYSEQTVVSGVVADGQTLIVFFGNAKTGTFTVAVVSIDGRACLVASGDRMKIEKQQSAGESL